MTDGQRGDQDEAHTIEDEAIAWLVRMRGPDAASLKGPFEQWLATSSDHRRAHDWALRHFEGAALLKQSGRHGANARRSRPVARWLVAGALTAAAASLLMIVVGTPLEHGNMPKSVTAPTAASPLMTARGEIRTFRLADGTAVTLDTDSKLAFKIDASSRQLDLERGKARIVVARDPRPFTVSAGAGAITAKVATLDLGYEDRQVLVRLISGDAEVRPVARNAVYMVPARQVFAGQSLSYRVSSFSYLPVPPRLRSVNDAQWPSGWVEYRAVPLSVLVDQANRYAAQPITVDGSTVGSLQASGRFRLTDTDAFARRIAEVFDLDVSRRPDGIHLSQK